MTTTNRSQAQQDHEPVEQVEIEERAPEDTDPSFDLVFKADEPSCLGVYIQTQKASSTGDSW